MGAEGVALVAEGVALRAADGPERFGGDADECYRLVRVAGEAASSKKAENTVILEVGPLIGITDYFVITSASNPRQVRTVAEEIEAQVRQAGRSGSPSTEGLDDARWVLLDYGDFVCHVFLDEARAYYDIERLWADAPRYEID